MEKTQTKRFCLIKLTKYASDERLKNSVILHAGQHANTCCGIGPESVAKREGLARSQHNILKQIYYKKPHKAFKLNQGMEYDGTHKLSILSICLPQ